MGRRSNDTSSSPSGLARVSMVKLVSGRSVIAHLPLFGFSMQRTRRATAVWQWGGGHCERSEAISSSRPALSMAGDCFVAPLLRSEEHTSELQSLMRNSYAVFCLKKQKQPHNHRLTIETSIHHIVRTQ